MKKILAIFLIAVATNAKVKTINTESFEEIQKSYLSQRESYFTSLTSLTIKSLDKKDCDSAKKYSLESFKIAEIVKDEWKTGGWNYGNAIFIGNMALGYCSLLENDLEQAIAYLKKGEKQPVINFLNQCLKFWKSDYSSKYVKSWIKSIEAGQNPDFSQHIE